MKRAWLIAVFTVFAACRLERAASGRPPGARTVADSLTAVEQDSAEVVSVETALRSYYRRVSSRSWRDVGLSFWSGATIATAWQPPGEGAKRVVVESVDDFVRRVADGPGALASFSVEPVHLDVRAYGPLAVAWVVVRSRAGRRRDSVETRYGVDAFHLLKHRGEWRITAVTLTSEVPGRPLAVTRP